MTLKEWLKKHFPDKKDIDDLDDPEPQKVQPPKDTDKKEIPSSDPAIADLKNIIETQKAENKKLLDAFAELRQKEEAREKLLEEKAKQDRDAQIEAVIKKAIEERRIPAKNEDLIKTHKALLEKDYDSAKSIIESLPQIGGDNKGAGGNSGSGDEGTQKGNKLLSPLSNGDPTLMKAIKEQNEI